MKGTFDNYFLGYTFVSAIVAVFDPRTNLEFVCYLFRYLYGDSTEKHTVIDDALGNNFNAYAKNLSSQGLSCSFINNDNSSSSYGDNPCIILRVKIFQLLGQWLLIFWQFQCQLLHQILF